tara:strand:+ start:2574 stop:2888 length:315 start_codon:yes stop_codon:yes gene_type:complete
MKNLQKIVRKYLEDNPKCKDNDQLLCSYIWHDQLKYQINGMSAIDLLKSYALGTLSPAHSITRCRRKLQETHAHLRGEMYEKRHKKAEEVKTQYLNWWESDGEM